MLETEDCFLSCRNSSSKSQEARPDTSAPTLPLRASKVGTSDRSDDAVDDDEDEAPPPAFVGESLKMDAPTQMTPDNINAMMGLLKTRENTRVLADYIQRELPPLYTALIAEREQGIAEIQQQIGEVNEIFQDLAVLVNEQGQMIDDIEANIVSTAVRTKDARRELTKADKSQKAARNKMICLAIVIAVVLIVLILFLLQ